MERVRPVSEGRVAWEELWPMKEDTRHCQPMNQWEGANGTNTSIFLSSCPLVFYEGLLVAEPHGKPGEKKLSFMFPLDQPAGTQNKGKNLENDLEGPIPHHSGI